MKTSGLSPSASVGRSAAYFGSPTGASMESESAPPAMKIEMTTGASGAAAAADWIPSSHAAGAIAPPPKTARASPLERARNERRDSPVPAGSGIPGSIERRPPPALAAVSRRIAERV